MEKRAKYCLVLTKDNEKGKFHGLLPNLFE